MMMTLMIIRCVSFPPAGWTTTLCASPVASQGGGVVILRFWTYSGFENWSSQWLSRENLDF